MGMLRRKMRKILDENGILEYVIPSILGIAVIGLFIWMLIPREVDIHVQDFSWEYKIDIEAYKTVHESGWSLPAGSRLQYKREEFYEYKEVLDHYETKTRSYDVTVQDGYEYYYTDNGDGTATEHSRPVYRTETKTETYKEPVYKKEEVYRTKYYYEIDKWVHERYVITNGTGKEPYWGEVRLEGEEREGMRYSQYTIGCLVKEEPKSFTCSEEIWRKLEPDSDYLVKVSAGTIIEIIE